MVAAGVAAKQGVGIVAAGRKGTGNAGNLAAWFCWELAMEQAREVHASIQYRVEENAVRLIYKVRGQGEEWQDMDYRVVLERTPCHYGGSRVWFRCPSCNRRVAVIYGGKGVCLSPLSPLAYDCQHETPDDRVSRQIDKLRDRLKWEPGLLNGKQWKPKWMRWRTYHRLETEYDERMRRLLVLMRGRFGL